MKPFSCRTMPHIFDLKQDAVNVWHQVMWQLSENVTLDLLSENVTLWGWRRYL